MTNKLTIDLEARVAQVIDSLSQIKRETEKTTTAMSAAFAGVKNVVAGVFAGITVGVIVDGIKSIVGELSSLDDAAEKTGGSVEQLSETFNRFRVGGGTLDELTNGVTRLVRSMQGADEESKGVGEALGNLGIKTRDAAGNLRNGVTVFNEVAEAFAKFPDSTEKTNYAIAIFGKSGAELLPKLKDLATETARFGTVSAEQAGNAEALEKSIRRISIASEIARQEFLSNFIPALESLATQFGIAQRAGLGFMGSLSTIPYANVTKFDQIRWSLEKIDKLQKELAAEDQPNLVDLGERFFGDNKTRGQLILDKIAAEEKRLSVLRSQLAAKVGNGMEDPAYPGNGTPGSGVQPVLKPLSTGTKVSKDSDPTKALEALAREQVRIFLDSQKQMAKDSQALLDAAYGEGLESVTSYFQKRSDIAESAYLTERMALEGLIGDQTAAVQKQAKGSKEWAEATKELEGSLAKRNQLDREFQQGVKTGELDRAKATREYADATAGLIAQLAAARGNSAASAVEAFDKQYRLLKAQAESGGDAVTQGAIAELRQQVELTAQYNDLAQRRAIIEEDLATRTARNQALVTTGAVTELEGAIRLGAIRQEAVPQLEAIAAAQAKVAESLNSPKLQADVRAFQVRTEELAASADVLREKFMSIGENAFSRLVDDAMSGTQTIGQLFRNMVKNILIDLAKVQMAGLGRKVVAGILGMASGSGSADVPYEYSGSGFANGGDPPVGKASLVGERGPELFVPKSAGTIIPNGGFGGSVNVYQTINIDSRSDIASIRAAMVQAERNAVAAVENKIRSGSGAFA